MHPTISQAVWPQTETNKWLRSVALVFVGVAALWISAKVQVPFWPVPVTMQTLIVLLIGMAYGPKLGVSTILAYLVAGAASLPVFAGTPEKGIGILYMVGTTGGYLVGFVVAAAVVGWMAAKGWTKSVVMVVAAMIIGNLVIYAFGFSWLSTFIGAEKAWIYGVKPFIWGDLLKIGLAAVILPGLWAMIRK